MKHWSWLWILLVGLFLAGCGGEQVPAPVGTVGDGAPLPTTEQLVASEAELATKAAAQPGGAAVTPILTAPTSESQTSTPEPPAPAPALSNGLGLTREEWEAGHGSGEALAGFYSYEGGRYVVGFQDGRVSYLERSWGDAPTTLEEARLAAQQLLPADSQFLETYTPAEEREADRYHSDWLTDKFIETAWINAAPGDFLVLYRVLNGVGVTSLIIAPGNNP